MVHIKEPLQLIGKSSPCGGSWLTLSLNEWSFTMCPTPYNRKLKNVFKLLSLGKNNNIIIKKICKQAALRLVCVFRQLSQLSDSQ